ncbi:retrotransposon protein, putative, ty3-gypsy subclass [Tanacetum coccineum]
MLQAFPVSLTGAASRWLRNQPSRSITTWKRWLNTLRNGTVEHLQGPKVLKVIEKVYAAQVGFKSISTAKADFSEIRRIGHEPYAVSGTQHRSLFSKTVPFPRRLQNFGCDDWREAQDVKILDTYDHSLPQKEKDPGSFTLPCFIHNICFDKALVDLGASVSVMPFSTYTNLGLGILSHTRYKYVITDLLPSLPINLMSKSFYYSIFGDKNKGKSHAETLIDIPVFVGSFSIVSGFTIIDDDDMTKDVVLGMKFCKKNNTAYPILTYVSTAGAIGNTTKKKCRLP